MNPDSRSAKRCADEVADTCIASRVRLINRVITGMYEASLAAHGVTASQYNILTALLKMELASPTLLAAALRLEKSTLSRNLPIMERNRWIETEGKGRSVEIRVTSKGEALFRSAYSDWRSAQARVSRLLGPRNVRALKDAAGSLARA